MDKNANVSIAQVLKLEGGFVNNKNDDGGPTNKGITLDTFRRFIKPTGSIDDLRKLSVAQASIVYRRRYWDPILGSMLPTGVDYAVFDYYVMSGKYAVTHLQRVVGAKEDGKLGPATLEAVNDRQILLGVDKLINAICDERLANYMRLPDWVHFGNGWRNRIANARAFALNL